MVGARIQLPCEGCGKTVSFPFSDAGTVQECPECGGYLDIPEALRLGAYEQQQPLFSVVGFWGKRRTIGQRNGSRLGQN